MDESRSTSRLDTPGSDAILAVTPEAADGPPRRSREGWYSRILAAIDEALQDTPVADG